MLNRHSVPVMKLITIRPTWSTKATKQDRITMATITRMVDSNNSDLPGHVHL
jgi:hypothetical protein